MSGDSGLARALGPAMVRAWRHRGPLACLMQPVSWLYALLAGVQRAFYRLGWLQPQRLPCAVVVVGNVVAGGAGKTPTTMGLVSHLRASGLAVGVVSRGYGRISDSVRMVQSGDDPADTGDEPLLIARATGAPVYVGRNRHAAASALLAAHPETQVIVCDDGLQHYALYRDVEVCVFDDRGVGNGWLLPAGPLREPWPRKTLAAMGQTAARTLVLHTGKAPAFGGFRAHRTLAPSALAHNGNAIPLDTLKAPLLALAGIATPDAFFASLSAAGVLFDKTLALPDHFDFAQLDTQQLVGYQVICTEKDAVKLWKVWPTALAVPLVQTLEPAFLTALDSMVQGVLRAKLSSGHGHQTT
jgi:tetraacyldisaccharide 4'-kinase